ncbi:MAG: aspartate aminotransferase family protein [Ardenticatenaceae bacterium]|nr:aspartate aminotransferase family protein [Ardenticatenaceae bacterium]HBY98823.1 aspartate aminotransferase family protein [Chloroflexota bacterium]
MMQWSKSQRLLERAKRSLAGGISSNVRASARPFPLFFEGGEGAIIQDVDGNRYIDYVLGQGPLILGHSPPAVVDVVARAIRGGQLFAAQHELEIEVAEKLVEILPGAELCRFGLSGSEVVQAAMRLARAVTGRTKILRFEGHYHGWFDNVLLNVATPLDQAGPRTRPHPTLATRGQAASVLQDVVVLPWNDLTLVEDLFAEVGDEIAAIITEPMMCNTGAIPPQPGYLEGLRRVCDRYGAVLIMDEVITGFRLGLQGAQGRFGVTPDLATLGKAMAGGFPCSALVGRRELMERFARDVNHSGTFNSNVMSMAASHATLAELAREDGEIYRQMEENGRALMGGIRAIAGRLGVPLLVQGLPTAFHLAFTALPAIRDYRDDALHCDKERYSRFTVAMLERGVRLIDRGIWYISAAHTPAHVAQTLETVEDALRAI